MNTLKLIIVLLILPLLGYTQKGNPHKSKTHKQQINKDYKVKKHYPSNKVVVYRAPKIKKKGPPSWAPANGYRHRHIYFPEYQCYYDTYTGMYIYRKGTIWVNSIYMPAFIVNIRTTRKVELNIDAVATPQIYFEQHFVWYH